MKIANLRAYIKLFSCNNLMAMVHNHFRTDFFRASAVGLVRERGQKCEFSFLPVRKKSRETGYAPLPYL